MMPEDAAGAALLGVLNKRPGVLSLPPTATREEQIKAINAIVKIVNGELVKSLYPIGACWMTTDATHSPLTVLGFGTWVAAPTYDPAVYVWKRTA